MATITTTAIEPKMKNSFIKPCWRRFEVMSGSRELARC